MMVYVVSPRLACNILRGVSNILAPFMCVNGKTFLFETPLNMILRNIVCFVKIDVTAGQLFYWIALDCTGP